MLPGQKLDIKKLTIQKEIIAIYGLVMADGNFAYFRISLKNAQYICVVFILLMKRLLTCISPF